MKRNVFRCTVPVVAAAVLGVAMWASAGDLNPPPGPITPTMKTLTEVEPRTAVQSLPGSATATYVIDQPGSYYLTGNITGEVDKNGIAIMADDVTLDLSGFALVGVPGSLNGILSDSAIENPAVCNGTVRGWGQTGVDLHWGWSCHVKDLRITRNGAHGLRVEDFSVIVDCTLDLNGNKGIVADGGCLISGCTVSGCGETGIYASHQCTITNCRMSVNGGSGIDAGSASTITNCASHSNYGYGIYARGGCLVVGNTSEYNDATGIRVFGPDNRIEANNVSLNDRGFDVDSAGNIIIKNTARWNAVNYDIVAGNTVGEILDYSSGGTITSSNPWANFEF